MTPAISNQQSTISEDNVPGVLMATCPLPVSDYRKIVLAHGGGGKLSQQLIQKIVLPRFRNKLLESLRRRSSGAPLEGSW